MQRRSKLVGLRARPKHFWAYSKLIRFKIRLPSKNWLETSLVRIQGASIFNTDWCTKYSKSSGLFEC